MGGNDEGFFINNFYELFIFCLSKMIGKEALGLQNTLKSTDIISAQLAVTMLHLYLTGFKMGLFREILLVQPQKFIHYCYKSLKHINILPNSKQLKI